ADGTVVCSSLAAAPTDGYHEAAWIPAGLDRATISPQVEDGRTGRQVVVLTAPVPGHGLVAAFLDLDALGPGLLSTLAGPRELEFLVTTGDRQLAVTRSIDPQRWAGTALTDTPFAETGQGSPRRDVEGTSRFYASAPVEATGWRVYAGADRHQALAMAHDVDRDDLVVASMILALVMATGFVLWRRIAAPIVALKDRMRVPISDAPQEPMVIRGPREIAELASHLNQLTESLDHELDVTARGAAIVESSNDSIISWTPSGIITTWNSRSEQMYGYPAEEAIGEDMSLIVPPERITEVALLHERALRGERVEPVETQKLRSDGSLIDVSVTFSPIRDRTGAVVGLSAVGRDITDSKRAVEALRSSEARKGGILASALDAIITMDHEGRIEEFNPAAERTFGFSAAEVIGRRLSEVIIPPEQREAIDRDLGRDLAAGESALVGRCTELTAIRADRTRFPAEVTINGVDVPGPPVFTGFIRDVTDRNAADAVRRSLEDRLHQSQRLESLGQLAGGVAHDFNNLLAVILNYATFVAEAVPDDEDVQFDVEQILSASERATMLTRQLLMFARREPVRPETLDLNAVVEDVRELLSRSIGAQIDLVVNAAPELPAIRADRGQTDQILLNLAVNARDAMPDGGILTLDTAAVDIDLEYIQLHPGTKPGPYVRLTVSDNGTGMSRDVASRAFEPFFTTKARTHGSGLGLATVYGIVAEAGGTVNLYSEEGLGTAVRVYFPATTDPAAAVTTRPHPTPVPGDRQTVLVVEDQDAVRALTVRILRRNGYVVYEAASGVEAIVIAAAHDVDLLLTDVVMPKMAGRELAGILTAEHPALPVLFMSGYAENILGPDRALDEGVALIQKPFNEATLLERVHEVIVAGARNVTAPRVPVIR
ncbi:MAG: two-component system, cell cycle sensor histidine kinase and response regulator CckA, partial [Actinomycetota bacterium]|nr:two-component system, cell cycle sensor histidine kinase and response regulator CckA [Actinomycetota bacterium]